METPVPSPSLRVVPPPIMHQLISRFLIGFVACAILFGMWIAIRTTEFWWLVPCVGLVIVGLGRQALLPIERGFTYGLDAQGVAFLDKNHATTHLLAWSDIVEVHLATQDDLFFYTEGRERFVKIATTYHNYSKAAPLLLEPLAWVWREMTKQVYNKSFRAYLVFLLYVIFIIVGVSTFTQNAFAASIVIGIGLCFVYAQLKSVWRLQLTSDGVVLTKIYGQELISAATISAIELQKAQGRRHNYNVLLKLRNKRIIPLHGFSVSPLSLYCTLALWHRDQLSNATV